MAFRVQIKSDYKSIKGGNEITLPDFCVITGLNGSGKTHFLEAIFGRESDAIAFENDTELKKKRFFRQIQTNPFTNDDSVAPRISDAKKFAKSLLAKYGDLQRTNNKTPIRKILKDDHQSRLLEQISRNAGKPIGELKPSDIDIYYPADDILLYSDVFQYNIQKYFKRYQDHYINNRFRRFRYKEDRVGSYLEKNEFEAKFGPPPWALFRDILQEFNSNVTVNDPSELEPEDDYLLRFINAKTGTEIGYKDLSSGEKIMISLASSLCKSDTQAEYPDILLLDEPDVYLHPSLTQNLLDVLNTFFVGKNNLKVVATTHSPSTVALSPEKSIHVMHAEASIPRKTNRDAAISDLTSGIPTLSISMDGRRQVFVESDVDARIYSKIYQLYRSELDPKRSLIFMPVGTKKESGDLGGGAERVEKFVKDLSDNGVKSVLGLVDWDKKRNPVKKTLVLSHNIRYSLENAILDPVLIAATAIKISREFCLKKGIIEEEDLYVNIRSWEEEKWQQVIRRIQNLVIGSDLGADTEILYKNGMSLKVSSEYLEMNGHKLEEELLSSLGCLYPLNNMNGKTGGLMHYVADEVLPDNRKLLPYDIWDTFEQLLSDS